MVRNLFVLFVSLTIFLFVTNTWGAGNLTSGSLSTAKLFDSSIYVGEPPPDYELRTPVANPPGGLSATAAWDQYGMKLFWNVTDNGNGTYTYYYHFWPGWEPATNGTGGGTGGSSGNPYVTNKEVLAFDLHLGSAMTIADIVNPTWNVYQYNGARIGSGTANTWINYDAATGSIINKLSDYDLSDPLYDGYSTTYLRVGNLKGKTGNATAGYLIQNLFSGLQWIMPTDPDTGSNLWKTDINFDLTFTSTYAPGWGNFFTNSGQTGSNNNYSEVVAFDGTFDGTGKSIATWSNSAATPGNPDNTMPTVKIDAPSAQITRNGPVNYSATCSDDNFFSFNLTPGSATLEKTGNAAGTISVSGTGSTRVVTISDITGDGTVGISLPAGICSDAWNNASQATGSSATFIVDNTPPAVLIGYPSPAFTRNGPVSFTVTYDDPNFNQCSLSNGHITLIKPESVNGLISVNGEGSIRTVTISNITGSGTLGISIAAGTASDTAGNIALSAGPSPTVSVDDIPPTAVINTSPAGPCKAGTPVTITAIFSEPMASNPVPQIALSGANSLAATNMTKIDETHYTYGYTAGSGDGDVNITLSAGTDFAGNAIVATPASGATISLDNTTPSLTVNQVSTPTNSTSQSIGGSIEAGTAVYVTLNNGTTLQATVNGSNWSFDITGLAYGTNAITVTASDSAGNTTLKSASIVRMPKFNVTVNGNGGGGGTVMSSPAGINCTNGTCSSLFGFGESVLLTATPDDNSVFGGWSGDCTGSGNCSLAMNSDRNAFASFTYVQPALISGSSSYFSTLSDAYSALNGNGTIQTRRYEFVENLTLNSATDVNLKGGYDTAYSDIAGYTTLHGTLSIVNGSLTVEQLIIR